MIDACDDNAMDVSEEALSFDDSSFCADEGKIERLLCQMDVCCARYCFKRIKEENGGIDQSVQYIKKCQEAVKRKATKEEKLHYIKTLLEGEKDKIICFLNNRITDIHC